MALVLRLAFVEVHSHANDVQAFAGWAIQLRYTPPWEFHSFAGYPPGYSVVLLAIGRLYGLITVYLPDPGGLLLRAMLKFPPIVMDVVNAWLVWGIARCVAPRLALTAAIVWLFNPVAWIDSTLWGQIDSVCWGFALAALLMLLLGTRDAAKTVPRFAWAWPLLAVSFLVKPVALPMLPAFVLYALFARGGTPQRRLAGSGAGIVAAALVCWGIASLFSGILNPFEAALTWIGYLGVHSMVGISGGSYTSVNAFNIWSVIMPFYLPDTIRLGGVSLAQIGFGLALLAVVAITVRFLQLRDERALVECAMLSVFALFLLATRMHERYVDGAVMLAVALIGLGPEYVAFAAIFTLTTSLDTLYGLHFADLFASTPPYAPLPGINLRDFWPAVSHPASLANVFLFAWMMWAYVRPRAPQPAIENG